MGEVQVTKNRIAGHILPTASNLLGLCFLLMSFIKVDTLRSVTVLDEFLLFPILIFFLAANCSYLSLRSMGKRVAFYESTADKLFISGLFSMTVISILFVLEFMH
ncbi:MAG: hypothetical protein SGI74_09635 [Oligoflexia bacterium]|nr:hypothetical protein [Oligoflexia bacterium]